MRILLCSPVNKLFVLHFSGKHIMCDSNNILYFCGCVCFAISFLPFFFLFLSVKLKKKLQSCSYSYFRPAVLKIFFWQIECNKVSWIKMQYFSFLLKDEFVMLKFYSQHVKLYICIYIGANSSVFLRMRNSRFTPEYLYS